LLLCAARGCSGPNEIAKHPAHAAINLRTTTQYRILKVSTSLLKLAREVPVKTWPGMEPKSYLYIILLAASSSSLIYLSMPVPEQNKKNSWNILTIVWLKFSELKNYLSNENLVLFISKI